MPPRGFEWDDVKARGNNGKHGLTFEVASRAFFDPLKVIVDDDREDYGEDRWNCIVMVAGHVLLVCYTMRGSNVRIISARRADRDEQDTYFVENG